MRSKTLAIAALLTVSVAIAQSAPKKLLAIDPFQTNGYFMIDGNYATELLATKYVVKVEAIQDGSMRFLEEVTITNGHYGKVDEAVITSLGENERFSFYVTAYNANDEVVGNSEYLESRADLGCGYGQPLVVEEDGVAHLIIGAYDHHLKKIRIRDGEIIWQYAFDDIIKGTGTIWRNLHAHNRESEYLILQGSRLGVGNSLSSSCIPSYRAISLQTGKALWKFNSRRTASYSRDVDGSALVLGDTAYIGLENGIFTIFHPDPTNVSLQQGIVQPIISKEVQLYEKQDQARHGGNLVTESSPCYLKGRIYITLRIRTCIWLQFKERMHRLGFFYRIRYGRKSCSDG